MKHLPSAARSVEDGLDGGAVEAFELFDLDEAEVGGLRSYGAELAILLSAEDVESLAAAVQPGSTAAAPRPRAIPLPATGVASRVIAPRQGNAV